MNSSNSAARHRSAELRRSREIISTQGDTMMPQDPPGPLRSPGVFHILRLLTLSCAPALLSCSLEANSASSENVALSVERLVSSLGLQSPATEEN